MAVTRIKNNQITDAITGNAVVGINANTKVQPYSITSNLLANNFTYGSDFTISGNLSVTGTTTAVDTTYTNIQDPLIVLADGQTTGAPALDIGYIGLRGNQSNIAFIWKEANAEFSTTYTTAGLDTSNTTITISSYANLKSNNINSVSTISAGGNLNTGANLNVTTDASIGGNLTVAGSTNVSAGGNVSFGGELSVAGNITATGNIGTAEYLFGDGYFISNINAGNIVGSSKIVNGGSYANVTTANGNVVIAVGTGSNIVATFYDQGVNFETTASVGGNIYAGAGISAVGDITAGGNVVGGNVNATTNVSAAGNVDANNVNSTNSVSAGGNVVGGNLLTTGSGGNISGSGWVLAGNISTGGNIYGGDKITAVGDVNAGANIYASLNMCAVGNITAGNITTSGNVEAGRFSATGQIIGQYISSTGNIRAEGNIRATENLNANIGVYAGTDVSAGGNIYANVDVSAIANVVGGNIITGGFVTAVGDVHGGNIYTANVVSAGGNITGGNIFATTDISAGANVTGGNLISNFLISNGSTLEISATGTLAGISLLTNGGNIGAGTNYINNVLAPVQGTDAANKEYVDSVASGLQVKTAVVLSTVAALPAYTYNQPNGAGNAVGATLTATSVGNLFVDGVQVSTLNERLLIQNEPGANAAYNGIYTVTTVPDATTAFVLTRASDFDVAVEVYGAYMLVTSGDTLAGTGQVCTNTAVSSPITWGVTPVTFSLFSSPTQYTQGDGILISGLTISTRVNTGNLEYDGGGNLQVSSSAQFTTPAIGSATGAQLSLSGNIQANSVFFTTQISSTGNIFAGYVSASGNVDGANINTGGVFATTVSASGNVTGANVNGSNVYVTTNVSAGGNVEANNVYVTSTVSAGGNITGANLFTTGSNGNISGAGWVKSGNVTTTGNIYAGINVSAGGNVYAVTDVSAGGNVYGNVGSFGNVTATGNVGAGAFLFGDGGYISNINAANVSSTKISNGGSYANIVSPDGNVVIAVGADSNIAATFYNQGVNFEINVSAGGNVLAGTGVSAGGNVDANNVNSTNNVSAGGNVYGANFATTGSGGNITGANVISATTFTAGGNVYAVTDVSAGGNVVGGNVNATTNVSAGGNVNGNNVNSTNLISAGGNIQSGATFLVDTTDNTVLMGNVTNLVTDSVLTLNATSSMVVPVGTTGERPVTPYTGMMRFNSTLNQMEVYNNSEWTGVGGTSYTVITDEQFDGDGATVTFTLSSAQTTSSCIVSINGVVQIPTLAYAVSGTTLTFTEAPAVGDVIDVRQLTTTTTVTYISNTSGNAEVSANYAKAQIDVTGNLVATLSATAPTLTANSTVSFQLVNNTTLAFVVRGTDGVTRTANVTLA